MKRWLNKGQLARTGKGSKPGAGYTITELLVVLAVTTVLFASILLYFRGNQDRAAFTQAVRNFEARLQTIVTEVSSGYYQSGFECNSTTNQPVVSATEVTPGSSEDCVFLGKVIVAHSEDIDIMTILGNRKATVGGSQIDATTLAEAAPRAIANSATKDLTEEFQLSFGLSIRAVFAMTGAGSNTVTEYGAFGILHELGAAAGTTSPLSGSRSLRLYGVDNTASPVTEPLAATANRVSAANLIPLPNGIRICLLGGNGQRAEITIGGSTGQTTITSVLDTRNTGACGNA